MDSEISVLKLLQKKHELFEQYEKETNNLLTAEIDYMDDYITNRAAIANDIDAINSEMHNIFAHCEDSDLKNAALCRCNDAKVSQEHRPLYEEARATYAIISRIDETEKLISENMKAQHAKLKERIGETKNTPKIARYLENLAAGRNASVLLDNEKKV